MQTRFTQLRFSGGFAPDIQLYFNQDLAESRVNVYRITCDRWIIRTWTIVSIIWRRFYDCFIQTLGDLFLKTRLVKASAPGLLSWLSTGASPGPGTINPLVPATMSAMNSLVELLAHVEADGNTHPDFGPKLNSRQCPVLQDNNGDVSDILAHSSRRSVEETIGQLIDCSNLCDLRETRLEIFSQAVGSLIEHEDPANLDVHTYKLKQRRGVKTAATTAMDIVLLFKFLCDTGCEFPVSVLANNRLMTHSPHQQQVHFGGSDSSSPQTSPPPAADPTRLPCLILSTHKMTYPVRSVLTVLSVTPQWQLPTGRTKAKIHHACLT